MRFGRLWQCLRENTKVTLALLIPAVLIRGFKGDYSNETSIYRPV